MAKRPVLPRQNDGAVQCEAGTGLVHSACGAAAADHAERRCAGDALKSISPFCHRTDTAEPDTPASGVPSGFTPIRPHSVPIVLEIENLACSTP
jgi:hypothetical protein